MGKYIKDDDDNYANLKYKTPLQVGDEVIIGKHINAQWNDSGLRGTIKYGRVLKAHIFGPNATTQVQYNNSVIQSIDFVQDDYYECEVIALDMKTDKMKCKKLKVDMHDIQKCNHGLFKQFKIK